jgi:anthranilate synthase/aminodeoxychorismate synthase-like glutamine amidotransferase
VVVLIDNYDSFTYNLAHRLGEAGADVRVYRHDAITLDGIADLRPSHLVISPGPGRPEQAGISVAALQRFAGTVPILGVCLGHQALATAFGGRVDRARAPMHGKVSTVTHDGQGVFAGLPATIDVGRYHSLVIPVDAIPSGFVVSATVQGGDDDGTVMGIRHRDWPMFGVQFHPESVLTPDGHRLLRTFLEAR